MKTRRKSGKFKSILLLNKDSTRACVSRRKFIKVYSRKLEETVTSGVKKKTKKKCHIVYVLAYVQSIVL